MPLYVIIVVRHLILFNSLTTNNTVVGESGL